MTDLFFADPFIDTNDSLPLEVEQHASRIRPLQCANPARITVVGVLNAGVRLKQLSPCRRPWSLLS